MKPKAFPRTRATALTLALAFCCAPPVFAQKIRVLVAYPQNVPSWMEIFERTPREFFTEEVITLTNDYFSNSSTTGLTMPTVELAGMVQVDYVTPWIDSLQPYLDSLIDGSDGVLDELHYLRDLYAADVVALVHAPASGSQVDCSAGGGATCSLGIGASAEYGFMMLSVWDMLESMDDIPAHELGHLFGCRHEFDEDPTLSPYAYGHGFSLPNDPDSVYFGDIMSRFNGAIPRVPWYSNPGLSYSSVPGGDSTIAFCSRVIHERKSDLAAFRSPLSHAVVQNLTLQAEDYGDVVGSNISTDGTVIVQEGAELRLRATGTVKLNSGLSVAGKLSIQVGSGALAKPAIKDIAREAQGKDQVDAPLAFAAAVTRHTPGALSIQYTLPQAGQLGVRVMSISGKAVYSASLPFRSSGAHEETLSLEPMRTGIYFVRLSFQGQAVSKKLFVSDKR